MSNYLTYFDVILYLILWLTSQKYTFNMKTLTSVHIFSIELKILKMITYFNLDSERNNHIFNIKDSF